MAPTRRDFFQLAAGVLGFTMIGEGRAIKPVAAADDASTDLWAAITRYLDLFRELPPDHQQRRIDTVWAYAESVADDRQIHAVVSDLAIHLEAIAADVEPEPELEAVRFSSYCGLHDPVQNQLLGGSFEGRVTGNHTFINMRSMLRPDEIDSFVLRSDHPAVANHYREMIRDMRIHRQEYDELTMNEGERR